DAGGGQERLETASGQVVAQIGGGVHAQALGVADAPDGQRASVAAGGAPDGAVTLVGPVAVGGEGGDQVAEVGGRAATRRGRGRRRGDRRSGGRGGGGRGRRGRGRCGGGDAAT